LRQALSYISFFVLTLYISGCSPKSVLTEPLLVSQAFKGNKTLPKERLEALLPQKPNKKLPLIPVTPGLYFYQFFSAKIPPFTYKTYAEKKIEWQKQLTKLNDDFDQQAKGLDNNSEQYLKLSKKKEQKTQKLNRKISEGNWAMRTFGEQPSYFYEEDAVKNVEKVKTYLKNHGFFNFTVAYKKDTTFFNRKGVAVTYSINEGTFYPLKQVDSLVVQDRTIREILRANQSESRLKVGERLALEDYNDEKVRIENLLKNNGYYNFTKENIAIRINDVDTASRKGIEAVTYIPNPSRPPQNVNYKKSYPINKVTFIADGSSPNITIPKVDTIFNKDIQYIFVNKKFSTKLLDSKIFIRPNQLYKLKDRLQTEKNLYGLDQFQFTRINFDTTRGLLDATIYARPLDKYQFTAETGGSVFKLVFGPFFNTSFKIRNIGGSSSSLETNFRFGFEAQTGFFNTDTVSRNLELGLSTSLIIPRILAPNFLAQRLNAYTPQTRLGVGAEFTARQEYSRLNFKINGTYQWRPTPNKYWQISLVDLNLIFTNNQTERFLAYLDTLKSKGNNLGQSFNRSFVSTISASYTYTDDPYGQIKKGKYLRLLMESGGTTLNFFPKGKIGFISGLFGDSLQFFKFLRVNADYRRYISFGGRKNSSFAYKINTGIAYSYGEGRNLPYEKNFFVGGPSSIRAWRPRTLGPGSSQTLTTSSTTSFKYLDQPGSILLETSAEYRFKILRFLADYNLNGAFFVDAGNVWRFQGQNTEGVTGSDFQFNRFYKEIAVGTGFGLRVDLSFFVLRLDWAIKVIDPSQKDGNRWVLFRGKENFTNGFENPLVLNFGIGYPF
jgi:outer membrane protein assembly factor BamA